MKLGHDGLRLRIFVHETLRHEHCLLYEHVVLKARSAGLAGATVFRGIEGFGAHHHIHTTRLLDVADDLPIIIEIIERPDAIRQFIDLLDGVIDHGMMTVSPVQIVKYSKENAE
jgi:PII-like signaling protein